MNDSCQHADPTDERLLKERLSKIKQTLVVLSGKGGVGKSTVAVNLALSLSLRGFRTGLLDVDIHGPSIPRLLNLNGHRLTDSEEGLDPIGCFRNLKVISMGFLLENDDHPVIWRGPMKGNVIKEFLQNVNWGELDYLVVDCPPGTGDEPLSVAQLLQGRASAVIVTTPQQVATIDVAKCITFCRQLHLPIVGIVENMSTFVCPDCGKETDIFSRGGGEELSTRFNVPFLGKIPLDPEIVQSGETGQPYVYFYPTTKTAERFEEIMKRISDNGHAFTEERPEVRRPDMPEKNSAKEKGEIMKFAVPTNEKKLCQHFGHCEAFALIDTDAEGKLSDETYVIPPPHEPGLLPPWLAQQGVNFVIAGGMGSHAKELFAASGINVVTGAQGEYPRDIVEAFLKGRLETGINTCDH